LNIRRLIRFTESIIDLGEDMQDYGMVSVVVPVYNTKEYLEQCVESILRQTYTNIEVILVDDGSNDGSGDLCEAFRKRDDRIMVIHQKNAGVSSARNAALKAAKGEFIAFVDSDDTVNSRFLEFLIENLIRNDADVSICGLKYTKEKQDIMRRENADAPVMVIEGKEIIKTLLEPNHYEGHLLDKLYRRKAVDGVFFDTDLAICEDMLFNVRCMRQCRKAVYQPIPLYHYFMRQSSACHSSMNDRKLTLFSAYQRAETILEDSGIENLHDMIEARMVYGCFTLFMILAYDKSGRKQYEKVLLDKLSSMDRKKVRSHLSRNDRIRWMTVKICPQIYYFVYRHK